MAFKFGYGLLKTNGCFSDIHVLEQGKFFDPQRNINDKLVHWKTWLWYFHWNSYIWVLIDAAMYMIITNINLTILSPDVHISSEKFTEWNYVKWHFYYMNRKTYTCKISHSKALVAQEYICGLSNFRVWHLQSLLSLQLL